MDNKIMANNEYLFFKIFRNVFLFRKILSLLRVSFRYEVYLEDEVNNVEWMIKNKFYLVLKEKIKNGNKELSFYTPSKLNHYYKLLAFRGNRDKELLEIITLHKYTIFSVIDQPEIFNLEFYDILFRNYSSDFFITNTSSKEIGNILIEYDNVNALQSLIETFQQFKPKEENLIRSIETCSFNISRYLYNYLNNKGSKVNQLNIWKQSFKLSDISNGLENNEKFKFLIEQLKFDNPITYMNKKELKPSVSIRYKLDYIIYKETLNSILESCILIATFGLDTSKIWESKKKQVKISSKELPESRYLEINDLYKTTEVKYHEILNLYLNESVETLTLSELEEIKNQFTPNQLSTKLHNFKLGNKDNLVFERNVEKLIKMLLPFFSEQDDVCNYSYYLIMYKCVTLDEKECKELYSTVFNKYIYREVKTLFFKFCHGRINRQIQFLNDYSGILSSTSSSIEIKYYFKLLLNSKSDLKLIEFVKEIMEKKIGTSKNAIQDTYLKSIIKQTLEDDKEQFEKELLLFNYIIDQELDNTGSPIILEYLFPKRIDVLNHMKLNYPNEYKSRLDKFNLKIPQNSMEVRNNRNSGCSITHSAIQFLIENIIDFKEKFIKQLLPHVYKRRNENDETRTIYVLSIINNPMKLYVIFKHGIQRSLLLFNYYDTGTLFYNSPEIGNSKVNMVGGISANDHELIIDDIVCKCDTKGIDLIINSNQSQFIEGLLYLSTHYSKLVVFQYIKSISSLLSTLSQPLIDILVTHANLCNHRSLLFYFKDTLKFDFKDIKINKSLINSDTSFNQLSTKEYEEKVKVIRNRKYNDDFYF